MSRNVRTGDAATRYEGSNEMLALPRTDALPRAKRIFDATLAAALLAALSPLAAFVLAAMSANMLLAPRDRGPFLYREQRISGGRRFDLLKLRTLRADVLAVAAGHVRPHEVDPANLTWAGRRILKPWYLDELPQLVNVLRGDISLVGPRPWPPELVESQLARGIDYRLRVRAGWTGPAQIAKGEELAEHGAEALDLDYVDRCGRSSALGLIRYDVAILHATLRTMLRREGMSY
jgi:lipopolysaccharide/colanic/teichoic acid biosynthesis glycosyltransferase